ncbi:MAG: glycine--tRNA ligase [Candidatus Saccharibacteria bacterium]|nr:glycine--tRNA ligase [Candidatus Saccharibacteria bacterium]
MEDIISLCKRRGFIFRGSEVYGGLAGTWDWGPLGTALKRNVMQAWWNYFVERRDDMYGVDAAIIMNPKVWRASGHVATFADPLVEDLVDHKRYRADHLLKDNGIEAEGLSNEEITKLIRDNNIKSPAGNELSDVRSFNMMFRTSVGAIESDDSIAYLRPETAQGIFTNYRNVVDSIYPDLPFGIAQQGRAFRNEISPRDFVFRSREFEQMEIEYFINPANWEEEFDKWVKLFHDFLENEMGLPASMIHDYEVPPADRAHYSKRTIDVLFDYPIGSEELMGIAYRTDFDLSNIQRESGKSMEYRPKNGGDPFVPHVIEPSIGVERLVMAILTAGYTEDEVDGDKRVLLKLPQNLAPVLVTVSPLLKNKPELVTKAREVYSQLQTAFPGKVNWDDSGNIGKRYRKADEIGVPHCVVVDFDSLDNDDVTVRDRDTTKQERVKIAKLADYLR